MSKALEVGDRVVFTNAAGKEDGTVTSMNERFIFVRFDGDAHAKACRRDDLER